MAIPRSSAKSCRITGEDPVAYATPHIEPVDHIDYRYEPRPWPFATEEAGAIDRHWNEITTRNSGLFNGRILIAHRLEIVERGETRVLEGACSDVEYKAFMSWRDFGFPDKEIFNCFAMGALISADGAYMLGEMNVKTASPGKIYFPAGTPDMNDIKGAVVDLEGSILRELEEETGIAPHEVEAGTGWRIVFEGPRVACMKRLDAPWPAEEIEARFHAFINGQEEPELVALHQVRSLTGLDSARMPDFILSYFRDVLG